MIPQSNKISLQYAINIALKSKSLPAQVTLCYIIKLLIFLPNMATFILNFYIKTINVSKFRKKFHIINRKVGEIDEIKNKFNLK